ncbi:MAG: hypothetical protein QM428_09165, partial [Verrucomicrobiota bacterium]|nr:hypothetical protein [Verrucomicrobiota bacterium]
GWSPAFLLLGSAFAGKGVIHDINDSLPWQPEFTVTANGRASSKDDVFRVNMDTFFDGSLHSERFSHSFWSYSGIDQLLSHKSTC